MKFIKKYIEYLKDNPEGYWFKRKLYGWGWVPAKWQGWATLLVYIILAIGSALIIDGGTPSDEVPAAFIIVLVALTLILVLISRKKGEKPKWQWGKDEK